ncbi:hypothetical protein ScPMuIL_002927 [Solemya velum]
MCPKMLSTVAFTLVLHTVWCADPLVSILETNPPTIPGTDKIHVLKNNDAYLPCVVENKPIAVDVQWVIPLPHMTISVSTATDSSDPFKYQIDQPSPNAWRLRVQNFQLSDEANYECRVQVGDKNFIQARRHLIATEQPQIIDLQTSSNTLLLEGQDVDLRCNASGRPAPLVKWQRMAGGTLPTGGRELRANVMHIYSARPEYRGEYKCVAENEVGKTERKIYLTVKFSPRIRPEVSRVLQAEGYLKELVCNIEAVPTPDIDGVMWSRQGVAITGPNYRVKNIQGASNRMMSKLTILNVGQDDYGEYTCQAVNDIGSAKTTLRLDYSAVPTPDRSGDVRSGSAVLAFSLTTILMLISICLLHKV